LARRIARHTMPRSVRQWLRRRVEGDRFTPRPGEVRLGDLERLTPISDRWGYDRGRPIDRHYIEAFLARHAGDVRGRVLEIGDSEYTRQFGGDRVARSDVLHVEEGNPAATIVADLADAPQIASETFDAVLCCQTLQLIYDVRAAVHTLHRIVKPGAPVLATFSGISRTSDPTWGDHWCWSFTERSARRLFEECFAPSRVAVEAHGNLLAATAFLHGLAAQELESEQLAYVDRGYAIVITVRAVK
jgi:hypothetical protein